MEELKDNVSRLRHLTFFRDLSIRSPSSILSFSRMIVPFDFCPRTRLIFGTGTVAQLGKVAAELGFRRTLLVADPGLAAVGYAERAAGFLRTEGIGVVPFHDFATNPDTAMVERGRLFAATQGIDSMVALGGGSSMDCAKGNQLRADEWRPHARLLGLWQGDPPLLPMIGVPTTAGTGSEAQSYALISDVETHVKMACGDPKAAFRVAILDPELTLSQPQAVTAWRAMTLCHTPLKAMYRPRATRCHDPFPARLGGCWRKITSGFWLTQETWRPEPQCSWGPAMAGWPLRIPCSELRMLAPIH